jgi:hypothetical protein
VVLAVVPSDMASVGTLVLVLVAQLALVLVAQLALV